MNPESLAVFINDPCPTCGRCSCHSEEAFGHRMACEVSQAERDAYEAEQAREACAEEGWFTGPAALVWGSSVGRGNL